MNVNMIQETKVIHGLGREETVEGQQPKFGCEKIGGNQNEVPDGEGSYTPRGRSANYTEGWGVGCQTGFSLLGVDDGGGVNRQYGRGIMSDLAILYFNG